MIKGDHQRAVKKLAKETDPAKKVRTQKRIDGFERGMKQYQMSLKTGHQMTHWTDNILEKAREASEIVPKKG